MQCLIKDVNKIAAKLREDRLIKSISRQETREHDGKLFHRTYYYIELGVFADAVKYRLLLMRRTLEEKIKNVPFASFLQLGAQCDAFPPHTWFRTLASEATCVKTAKRPLGRLTLTSSSTPRPCFSTATLVAPK